MTCKVARLSLCLYIRMFCLSLLHAVNCGVSVLALSVTFLFVYEISLEPQYWFAPSSHARRAWSLAQMSLKIKVKGQRSRSSGTKTAFFGPFGGLRAVCLVIHFIIPWVKKGCHPSHGYNVVNSWSICKILSLLQRAVNFQQNAY